MRIIIESIPKSQHRYDTWGDYFFDDDGTLHIRVTEDEPELPTDNHKFLIALHELVEVWLCKNREITQEMVDAFDFDNQEYCNENDIEPGDMVDAPYRNEHRFAMLIEHLVARELGMTGYGIVR